ncbi:uncharacterized protein L199_008103 [Kwoniella botswanensis]|uniref:uncharacterized protein n=1 Tax=Kwoniella botswanensis TaxID=1268659 RepID=UPI00315D170F
MSRNEASLDTTDKFPLIISVMKGTNNNSQSSTATTTTTATATSTSDDRTGNGIYQQSNDTQVTVIEYGGSGLGERSEMYKNPAANESAITVHHVGSTSAGEK